MLHQLNSSLCSVTCLFISDSGGINNSLFAWDTDLINSATHPRPGCLWEHLPLTGPSRPRVKLRAPSLPYSPSGEGPECPARPEPAANGAFGEGELGAAARSSPLPLPPGTPGEVSKPRPGFCGMLIQPLRAGSRPGSELCSGIICPVVEPALRSRRSSRAPRHAPYNAFMGLSPRAVR